MNGAEEDELRADLARQEALVQNIERQRDEALARLGVLRNQVAAVRAPAIQTPAPLRASESVAAPYTGDDKLKLFRTLFHGREDIYPPRHRSSRKRNRSATARR